MKTLSIGYSFLLLCVILTLEAILWKLKKVEKYKAIVAKKVRKYGFCNTILIREIAGSENAILLQNAFPTLEKYIDHPHMINGKPIKVIDTLKNEILTNFEQMIQLKKKGINLFFVDIDAIKEKIQEEISVSI